MLLQLDFQSEVPFYQQLRTQIIAGVATGKLQPGEALPSVRQLAGDLGINMHTVNKTYNWLRQDGFIIIHRQKGAVIAEDSPGVSEQFLKRLQDDLRPLITEAFGRGLTSRSLLEVCEAVYRQLQENGGNER